MEMWICDQVNPLFGSKLAPQILAC